MKSSEIFRYSNYVQFLQDWFREQCSVNPDFSYTRWAKEMQISNLPSLTRVLNGDRAPGDDILNHFFNYFAFSENAKEYFTILVLIQKEKNPKIKAVHEARLEELRRLEDPAAQPLLETQARILFLWGSVNEAALSKYLGQYGFDSVQSYGHAGSAVCLKASYTHTSGIGAYQEFNFACYVKRKGAPLGESELFFDKIYCDQRNVVRAFRNWGSPFELKDVKCSVDSETEPMTFELSDGGDSALRFSMGVSGVPLGKASQPLDTYGYNPIHKHERAFFMKLNSTALFREFDPTFDNYIPNRDSEVGRFLEILQFQPKYWTFHPDFTATIYPTVARN